MKKIFYILTIFAALSLAACEDIIPDELPDNNQTEQNGGEAGDDDDNSGDGMLGDSGNSSDEENPSEPSTPQTSNKIYYTTNDGKTTDANIADDVFGVGVKIMSNVYEDGRGVITFNKNLSEIGEYAFNYCTNLTNITLPESVRMIGNYAFAGCRNLSEITIPYNVTNIGYGVFSQCYGLTAFYGKFASDDNKCLIVDGVLRSFAFGNEFESYTIPDGVTYVGQQAFAYMRRLKI